MSEQHEATTATQASAGGEQPAAAAAGRARKPHPARRPAVAWTVAAVMALVAIGFAAAWAPLYTQAKDRERVREAAEQLVLHLTTFEGATIDEWVQETQRRATDDYAEEVNTLFDAELRAALRDAEAKSIGTLVSLFVQDIDGDEALVFVVVRQTITNAQAPQPVEDELRMQLELRQDGGQWKAARVEVLGPQGGQDAGLLDDAPAGGAAEEGS